MAELSLPLGVVGCANFEAICFAVSTDVSMPSTCRHHVMCEPYAKPCAEPYAVPPRILSKIHGACSGS